MAFILNIQLGPFFELFSGPRGIREKNFKIKTWCN